MPNRDRPTPPTGPGSLGGDHRSATRPLPAPPWIPLQPEVYRTGLATADPPALLVWLRRALLLVAIAALAVAVAELVYRLGTVPPPPGTG